MKRDDYLTVSDLNSLIKDALEGNPSFRNITLKGEISNFKVYPSGHAYFSLKDDRSVISAVMWGSYTARLTFPPKDGDAVLAMGRISVYPPRGSYQFQVERMQRFGEGEELQKLRELAEKLRKEGLFDESRKRPLAQFPTKIAVIAGKGSAGMKDIVHNCTLRWPLAELALFPSLVQGADAPKDLIRALKEAQEAKPDTIIIGRGGGSSEDLSAFNDEALVREAAACKIPLISAVGHEVDTTLIDLVADKRVSTPTGAAVAATPDQYEVMQMLDDLSNRLISNVNGLLTRLRERLELLSQRSIFLKPEAIYEKYLEKVGDLGSRINRAMANRLAYLNQTIEMRQKQIAALGPKQVLTRGYSIAMDAKGKVITSLSEVEEGDVISNVLKDGIITARVEKKENRHGRE